MLDADFIITVLLLCNFYTHLEEKSGVFERVKFELVYENKFLNEICTGKNVWCITRRGPLS